MKLNEKYVTIQMKTKKLYQRVLRFCVCIEIAYNIMIYEHELRYFFVPWKLKITFYKLKTRQH